MKPLKTTVVLLGLLATAVVNADENIVGTQRRKFVIRSNSMREENKSMAFFFCRHQAQCRQPRSRPVEPYPSGKGPLHEALLQTAGIREERPQLQQAQLTGDRPSHAHTTGGPSHPRQAAPTQATDCTQRTWRTRTAKPSAARAAAGGRQEGRH